MNVLISEVVTVLMFLPELTDCRESEISFDEGVVPLMPLAYT